MADEAVAAVAAETPAPAPEAKPAETQEPEWKAKIKAHIEAKKAVSQPKPVVVREEGAEAPAKVTPIAAKETTNPADPAKASEEPAKPSADDELAAKLLEISKRTLALSRREKAAAEREKAAAEKYKPDLDLATKLRAAQSAGKRLDILRAAGISDEQIRGTWIIDLLDELKQEEEGAPPLTQAQAEALWQQKEAAKAAEAKKREDDARAAKEAEADQARASYFGEVAHEFKANRAKYPILAALPRDARPSLEKNGDLDRFFWSHFNATGVALKAPELLEAFEKRYRDAGFTAPAPKASEAKPTAKPAPKVVGSERLSDGGGRAVDIKTGETYRERTERLKEEMKKRFPRKSA